MKLLFIKYVPWADYLKINFALLCCLRCGFFYHEKAGQYATRTRKKCINEVVARSVCLQCINFDPLYSLGRLGRF